jgi:hypothetical protein
MQNNSIQRVCRPIKDETEIFLKDSTSFVRNSLQTQFKFTYVYPSLRWLLTQETRKSYTATSEP